MDKKLKSRFAVFASGHGSNLQVIIEAVKAGEIDAELALVFSNNRKARALKRATDAGIQTLCLVRKDYATPQSYDRAIVNELKKESIDFIALAGYMKILTAYFTKEYKNRIINVHPSLLPSFKGKQGIKDAFTYGAKITGVTIHFVNEKMDAGPIILQESFKIQERDTLETLTEKVHAVEHKIFPKALALYAAGRLKVVGRKVIIMPKA